MKRLAIFFLFFLLPVFCLAEEKVYTNADLSETLVKRISHQVEQHCRDVEPAAYSKN